jgi:hypothetical protein
MQRQSWMIGWIGVGLLAALFLPIRSLPERFAPEALPQVRIRQRSLDPFEAALQAARKAKTAAVIEANQEQEKVEAWDPTAAADLNPEQWHEELMAADPNGQLRQAHAAARRAAALARSPAQAVRVAEFLMLLEHEAGQHTAALHDARRMVALCPRQKRARMVLRTAELCMARAARSNEN